MKVSIDFGTQSDIPPNLLSFIVSTIRYRMDQIGDNSHTLSKVIMYLNFYDDDGNLVEFCNDLGHELNYNFRTVPYKIKRKNVMEPTTITVKDTDGEPKLYGYLYPYYKE